MNSRIMNEENHTTVFEIDFQIRIIDKINLDIGDMLSWRERKKKEKIKGNQRQIKDQK